ncbi:MAG TPA: YihY/virulence factor BrkB family protein [Baekduia sp.]|nr:YihY/virulence factor BrkB family protein [Baekduia sp.]
MADGMLERAPGMAYYGILSIFPTLLIAFSLLRLVAGSSAPEDLAAYARDEGASVALSSALRSAARTAQQTSTSTAGTAGLLGAMTALYGASRAFTAAGRALDVVAGLDSRRRSPLRRAQDLGWTLVVLVLASIVLGLSLISGDLLTDAARLVGIEGRLLGLLARAAALVVTALLIVALVRWSAPTGSRPPFRAVTPGGALSVATLLIASLGFDLYVATLAGYNETYGAFAGAIVLILWLWIGASAFLLGAELDAELAARRPPPAPLR